VNHWSITMPLLALAIQPASWLLVGRSSSITAMRVMGGGGQWRVRGLSGPPGAAGVSFSSGGGAFMPPA
jgi:hypothetical protein